MKYFEWFIAIIFGLVMTIQYPFIVWYRYSKDIYQEIQAEKMDTVD